MSDHDHSHHGHDHDHDHHHDHDHGDHGHDHPHPPAAPEPPPMEDAGSQALSEALKSSFAIVKIVMILLLVVFICSGFFKVGNQEKAIILRNGRPVGEGNKALLGAGLHWSFPAPIDEVVRIPYTQLQQVKSDIGWYKTTPEKEALDQEDPAGPSLNPAVDGYTITGDGNIIHTRATLYYHIEDPIVYHFDFSNASNTVQNALDNALVYCSASHKVDDVLTREITAFQDAVRARVTQLVQKENLGIVIDQCQVQSRAPRYLKTAFDSVLSALSAQQKVINEARSYENQVLSKAEADAAGRTNSAQAQRVALVKTVAAEAQSFNELLPRYEANPALFSSVFLNERLGRVLGNVKEKFYLAERADGKTRELRLQLSREPAKAAPTQPESPK
jgi:modulator of FtsH protease HflK